MMAHLVLVFNVTLNIVMAPGHVAQLAFMILIVERQIAVIVGTHDKFKINFIWYSAFF